MRKRQKFAQILTAAVPSAVFAILTVLNLLTPAPAVLEAERRQPAALPELTLSSLLGGGFMAGFDSWATDSFVFRDTLRSVRAYTVLGAFMQTDKSGLYTDRAVGAGRIKTADEAALLRTAEKLVKVIEDLAGMNVYFAVIPDKSEYAERKYPGTDFDTVRIPFENLSGVTGIDISSALCARSWYRTDLHWDQAEIGGVAALLSQEMGVRTDDGFESISAGNFLGVYAGQLAVALKPDNMRYVITDTNSRAVVSYIDAATLEWIPGLMYDLEAFSGRDPYDIFLGGTQPLVKIDNPSAETERELFIFRDSFASSLAPLLTAGYSRVTLIDLRYIDARLLPRLVDMPQGSDVLFIYSTDILASPDILLTG